MTNGRPHSDLRPEVLVLLSCARRSMSPVQRELTTRLLRETIDWDRLLSLCTRHAVLPLVERQLAAHFAELIPPAVRERLGRAARAALAQSVALAAELRRILADFRSHGIRALAYKGPGLALQIYGDVTLRTFRDLDVLVTRADFFRARDALARLGYRPGDAITGAQEEALLRSECDQTLIHDGSGALVELHWAVTPPHFSFPLETEALLERAVIIELAGLPVSAPSREDLLLLVAMNGAKDLWLRLEPACLIAEMLVMAPIDWPRLFALARGLHAERILMLGLTVASELLGVPLPEMVRERQDAALVALAREAQARLLDDERPAPGPVEIARFRLRTRERWADRIAYCARWAVTPTKADCAVLPLPRALWPLAYAIRPLRLLARSVRPGGEAQ